MKVWGMIVAALVVCCEPAAAAAQDADWDAVDRTYQSQIEPLLKRYCHECHSRDTTEAQIDFGVIAALADIRLQPETWQKVGEVLASGQMPPQEAAQPTDAERAQLRKWVQGYLSLESAARAGDPGRVVLRRLSNAEYTYTLRDLTGVASLDPAHEFPVDGAAGEGFTNTGNALVMSPALVTKYLDAAKEIASHAVLLPDGFRFSSSTTRADHTQEVLAQIREFYRQYSDQSGGDRVNLQGIVFNTNEGGRLPLERYLAATLEERESLTSGKKSLAAIAGERGLSPKYLSTLWQALNAKPAQPSLLLDGLRARWRAAKPDEAAALAAEVSQWQAALWRFTSVGHIGKVGGPKAWMEPLTPLADRQELRLKLPSAANGSDVVLYLSAGDAGDGNEHDFPVWERPRLVAPGRPDLLLRDVRPVTRELAARREQIIASAAQCLAAAAEAASASGEVKGDELAARHGVESQTLVAWLDYLGITAGGPAKLGTPISRKIESSAGYDFVRGWVGDDALSVVANSSDQHVRIPGNMKPHGVAVHPTPTLAVAVGWRSPIAATLKIEGAVQHAHPECGNGVAWSVELRRGNARQRLAAGTAQGAQVVPFGPLENVSVRAGDSIALVIGPRDGNHSCDLTAIDMTIEGGEKKWSLAGDLSPDILAGNPHDDSHGNKGVWHFFSEPASGVAGHVIPAGSLLAKWQAAASTGDRKMLADELQRLLESGIANLPKDSPDAALYQQLTSLGGPLLAAAAQAIAANPAKSSAEGADSPYGLDPALFGKHPTGAAVDGASLCMNAPTVLELRLPADLVAGCEFVAGGTLHADTGREGSVQLQILTEKPAGVAGLKPTAVTATAAAGPWTSNNRGVAYGSPVIVTDGSAARKRFEAAYDEFRQLFPAALCYTKIVPVDEVVTLTLYYREDDHLLKLMLGEDQTARLNKLWDELHYISADALTLVDALEQLIQYATQDADPKVFEPLREPFAARAAAYRQQLVDTEPAHLQALLDFAGRAYRRPLAPSEAAELRGLYARLRAEEIPHDEAFRLTLARVLVAPAFLYRIEKPVAGQGQGPVTDWELASRLSYFLWSSQPDDELRQLAAAGQLQNHEAILQQTRRMLQGDRTRRLAEEFACQWLHIRDFDQLDEKSERHFPTFAGVKDDMYEEAIRLFTDMFQNDGSILGLIDADHTFLNEELAKHYGIPGVAGSEWRRVEGVKQHSRGGILSLGATLATQSGASRTSPILRGNWLSEVVLGEKLPRPPKNVPQLADAPPEGLTERQLIERHSSDAACAKCHARIDPFGFALEGFDAIGRLREKDAGGLAIDTRTTLPDGTKLDGLPGLQKYLLTARREAFLRQFNRKLLGFALGRSVQLGDESLLAKMRSDLEASDYKVGSAIEAIVTSQQFREIRGRDSVYNEPAN
jgi:hypothetical protein